MPFPFAITGSFTSEDDQYFTDMYDDPGIRYETDGGLVVTRKRYTRVASRMLTTGMTMCDLATKNNLDALWNSVGGTAGSWVYTHPLTAEALTVRFDKAYKVKYTGIGITRTWDITDITLRTV